MAAAQVLGSKGRDGDGTSLQLCEGPSQPRQVLGIGEDGEVGIAAKFRRALEHARLAAHEEGLDVVLAHRRKDFAYRVRD